MVSTYTANKAIEKPASGDYVNTWATPVNADWDIIDKALGSTTNLNVTAVSGTVILTTTQYQALILNISGTLTANVTYQIPSGVGGQWMIKNGTTGAYTVTISSGGGGTTINVSQGYNTIVVADGTNITLAVNTPPPAAGSNTQVQYNTGNLLNASSGFTTDGSSITLSGGVTAGTTVVATSTVTGSALVPSGAAVPANGVFLPAANAVGVASNSTERIRLASTGALGLSGANYGTSGQFLQSNGSASAPTWGTVVLVGVQGTRSNLKVQANAGAATVDVTANSLMLSDGSGNFYVANNPSLTINSGTSGANGLDTGTVAASTWYSVWAIYNGTTVSGLISISATTPTLPGGYTYKARVGWVRTSGTAAQFYGSLQYNTRAQWTVDGTVLTNWPIVVSGNNSGPISYAYTSLGFAPSTSSGIILIAHGTNSSSGFAGIYPNNVVTIPSIGTAQSNGNSVQGVVVPESTNIYVTTQTNSQVYSIGWEDNL